MQHFSKVKSMWYVTTMMLFFLPFFVKVWNGFINVFIRKCKSNVSSKTTYQEN